MPTSRLNVVMNLARIGFTPPKPGHKKPNVVQHFLPGAVLAGEYLAPRLVGLFHRYFSAQVDFLRQDGGAFIRRAFDFVDPQVPRRELSTLVILGTGRQMWRPGHSSVTTLGSVDRPYGAIGIIPPEVPIFEAVLKAETVPTMWDGGIVLGARLRRNYEPGEKKIFQVFYVPPGVQPRQPQWRNTQLHAYPPVTEAWRNEQILRYRLLDLCLREPEFFFEPMEVESK